jgi:hypothetical protein
MAEPIVKDRVSSKCRAANVARILDPAATPGQQRRRALRFLAPSLVLLLACGCDEVRTPAPPPRRPAGEAPKKPILPARKPEEKSWSGADARRVASALVAELLRGDRVKQHQAAHGGQKPVVGVAIELRSGPDGALEESALREGVWAALKRGGLRAVLHRGHPHVYSGDPRFGVRFSPGVGSKPGPGGPHWSLVARVHWKDGPAAGKRTYEVELSVVALDRNARLWHGRRTLVRRRPAAVKAAGPAPVVTSCAAGPAWLKLAACTHGGLAYAVSRPGRRTRRLLGGPHTLISEPLAELMGPLVAKHGGRLKLNFDAVEAVDAFRCGGGTYLLLRTRQGRIVRSGLPACDAAKVTARSKLPAGCHAWIRLRFGRTGKQIFGVVAGRVGGRHDSRALMRGAESAARQALGMEVQVVQNATGRRVTGHGRAPDLGNEAYKQTSCGGWRFLRFSADLVRP